MDQNEANRTRGLENLFSDAATFHKQGRLEEAARGYEAVLAINPRFFDVLHLLGVLKAQQNQLSEAERLLRQAIALNPTSAPAHINLGTTLNLDKRFGEAIPTLEKAIALNERDPIAYNNLGNALKGLGRHQDAAESFRKAVELKPDYVEALSNFGAALHEQRRDKQAIHFLTQALKLNPAFMEAHLNLGIVLHELGRPSEALACFERVLAADPRNVVAYERIGLIHGDHGRFAEARDCYARALEIEPRNARLLYYMVQFGKVATDDPYLATLESLSENTAELDEEQRIMVCFALSKAYADLGQQERGFRWLQDGNALKRRRVSYDETASLALFDRIRAVFSPEFLASREGFGNPSQRPIFIVGMMRSGSTLVEQILASHPDVFAAGERLDFKEVYRELCASLALREKYPDTVSLFTSAQFRLLGDEYLNRIEPLAAGHRALRISDKLPGNLSVVGLIRLALPNARIIHTVREPVDTCLSCYSMLFGDDQPFAFDLGELGRYYRGYARLMEHWHRVLPKNAILRVKYEELVGDFENQVRRILDHCGLEWNEACLSFHRTDRPVRTVSQMQVRQPLYRGSIARWRPEAAIMRPLLEGLGCDNDGIFRSANEGTGGS